MSHIDRRGTRRQGRPLKDYSRAYKACIPCRKTKARCELAADSEPCIKCKRELKECVFTAERSTKRRATADVRGKTPQAAPVLADTTRNPDCTLDLVHSSEQTQEKPQRVELPTCSAPPRALEARINADFDNEVMETVVSCSKDALGLLFKAAEQQDVDELEADRQVHSPVTPLTNPSTVNFNPSPPVRLSEPSQEVIELWSRHRFVRQGWFSAQEAVTYIDLFYRNLSFLSPVADTYYARHENHKALILEEPLLCCSLLMISSRYHVLPGQGGASRAGFIHSRLWKHCEHLIQRITFGAEKYSLARTRTLGSIRAFLLITEWHPRALHFPPENDGWDVSLAPSIDDSFGNHQRDGDIHLIRWREEVFEPAKRSDRMSWTMLGLATTLAHELGVFEESEVNQDLTDNIDLQRAQHEIRMLLYLYGNQLALRLGCTSVVPRSYCHLSGYTESLSAHEPAEQASKDRDRMIAKWIDITKILETAKDMLFPNKSTTRQILKNGNYIALSEHFQPVLAQWHSEFTAMDLPTIHDAGKQALLLDYFYTRVYISSLSLQALIERLNRRSSSDIWLDQAFQRNQYADEFKSINAVREASREAISIAIKLGESGCLRYCPVRVLLRIVSVSIFLLKSISIGARNENFRYDLDILYRCNQVLKANQHDDIDLSARYGTLIGRHVQRLIRKFGLQPNGNAEIADPSSRCVPRTTQAHLWRGDGSRDTNFGEQRSDTGHDSTLPELNPSHGLNMDGWLRQDEPLPAEFDAGQSTSQFAIDSLDFLWELPI